MPNSIGAAQPPIPEDEPGEESERTALLWRRDFLARLIPDLQLGRIRTQDGAFNSSEETLQCLRLRLEEIEARLARLDAPDSPAG